MRTIRDRRWPVQIPSPAGGLSLGVALAFSCCCLALAALAAQSHPVQVVDVPAEARVDVLVGGQPFTSYRYPSSLQKPVLFPIRSAAGRTVTRGYPLEPRPGERADHPHHVGHWFNYGDVNGYDFWGHSDATPAGNKGKMGTIVHEAIKEAKSGETGQLTVSANWLLPDGSTLLREQTLFTFSAGPARRGIDRTTIWTAAGNPVTFGDTKEGAFGIRVARALDHPSQAPEVVVAADGKGTEKRVDSSTPSGRYFGSGGKSGEAVWGTRGPWMGLTGTIDNGPITLAILDHPSNHGHPTYWHARGYGLFAANPIGQQGYDPAQKPSTLTLQPGQSVRFRHRILVLDRQADAAVLQQEFESFSR